MPGLLRKRSINLSGHATSLALEPEFWAVLEAMAGGGTLAAVIGRIDESRGVRPLASACRVAALRWAGRMVRAEDALHDPHAGSDRRNVDSD